MPRRRSKGPRNVPHEFLQSFAEIHGYAGKSWQALQPNRIDAMISPSEKNRPERDIHRQGIEVLTAEEQRRAVVDAVAEHLFS